MKYRPALNLIFVCSLVFCVGAAHAQTAAPAHKPANSNASGSGKSTPAKTSATTVTKKITFTEDTFSAKRKLLDAWAQSLSVKDLEAQKKAAADGVADAMYLLGAYSPEAKQWWSQAAEKG